MGRNGSVQVNHHRDVPNIFAGDCLAELPLEKAAQEVALLTLFGFIAVTVMFVGYSLELRSRWMVLLFTGGCGLTSAYSAIVAAYPIAIIEALWGLVALQRFYRRLRAETSAVGRVGS